MIGMIVLFASMLATGVLSSPPGQRDDPLSRVSRPALSLRRAARWTSHRTRPIARSTPAIWYWPAGRPEDQGSTRYRQVIVSQHGQDAARV
ncbi:hypothetical protein GCM10020220_036990 [Nonomuraea rubra]|uniref:hypothetical protein n=1 Tax=Nonomuraea rubra TaxID=46180 RepID=UPI0031E8BCF7